ncbi:MAG: hypothetical protein KKC79_07815 [Gammaproteobacteria bacterium]|nr:hypothetical protein [Gammaproteobacteria bacterium]MBU1441074.1 hypothetical protein [Gammaproteobacteria bacterium]MBU2408542.1 hypothetical protein [Gammaproteobacteria bacterium]
MKTILLSTAFLLSTALCAPAYSQAALTSVATVAPGSSASVSRHRDARVQVQVQREEAFMGRRLNPAELAELRRQVRDEWRASQRLIRSAESVPAERLAAEPVVLETPAALTATDGAIIKSRRP